MTGPAKAECAATAPTPPPRAQAAAPVTPRDRNPAIDLTKGALVVLMFVYHSVNYFCQDKDVLRYLHFLPSSFIFIAGFLVTFVQQPKYERGQGGIRLHLLVRGLKLFAIFLGLNLLAHSIFSFSYNTRSLGVGVFIAHLDDILIAGGQRAAVFDVLLPISYLLVLSSVLVARRSLRIWAIGTPTVLAIIACLLLSDSGDLTSNFELLSMGLLGMSLGLLPLSRIVALVRWPAAVVIANVLYAGLEAFQYPVYPINLVGVCLTLLMLFALGIHTSPAGAAYRWLVLLGRYSLVGYIVQIAILQVLYRLWLHAGFTGYGFAPAALVTAVATTLLVVGLDRVRQRSPAAETSYRLLFA